MNWLNRFSIAQLITFGASIFLILLAVLVVKNVSHSVTQASHATEDQNLIVLLDSLEKIAHNHAVERGLTAGYLGSITTEAKSKVDQQRIKADSAVNHFEELLKNDWPESYLVKEKVSSLQAILIRKRDIRAQVDNLNGKEAFVYYSKLNKAALDALANLTINIHNTDASNKLTLALQLAWLKEKLGQVRGKTNGVLAKQASTPSVTAEIVYYGSEIKYHSDILINLLPKEELSTFKQITQSSNAQLMIKVLSELQKNEIAFSTLPSSNVWFKASTQQISQVKKLLDAQWSSINLYAADQAETETTSLWGLLIATVAIILFLIIVFSIMIKSLKSQLRALVKSLENVAQEGDLTVEINLDTKNELGEISVQVNKTIWALKDLVLGLANSLNVADRISHELHTSTKIVLEDSNATEQKAIEIASSIEQMAQTSQQIAQLATDTLSASQSLDAVANDAITANSDINQAMIGLNSDMTSVAEQARDMGQKMSDIGGILDTINSLSDQTNLLSLNAAIEAARAGEHGRGFAVVADEVRQLAMASRESTNKISELLDSLNQASAVVIEGINQNAERAKNSLAITEQGANTAQQVKQNSANVEELSNSMASSAEEQSITSAQIAQNILTVQASATKEQQVASELSDMAEDLKKNNETLQRTMDYFKVS